MSQEMDGRYPEVCVASQLQLLVDAALNKGAINEATGATDETRDIEEDAVDTIGSAYITEPVNFEPDTLGCVMCKGEATLHEDGSVTADDCRISGSCELTWVLLHGDAYLTDDGKLDADLLPCGGFGCRATVGLGVERGAVSAEIVLGKCAVDVKGDEWKNTGREKLNVMKPAYDIDDVEPYDGA